MTSNLVGPGYMPLGFQDRETTFPFMIYDLLEGAHRLGIEEIVSWNADGQSFQVHDREKFTEQVLPRVFKQTRFKSFQRQLNLYFFQRIRAGPLRGSYAHSSFRRGERKLCHLIIRMSSPGILQCASRSSTSGTSKSPLMKNEDYVSSGLVLPPKEREQLPHRSCNKQDSGILWHQKSNVCEPSSQCLDGKRLQSALLEEHANSDALKSMLLRRCELSLEILSPTTPNIYQQEEAPAVATPVSVQSDRSIVDEIIATFQKEDYQIWEEPQLTVVDY